MTDRHLVKIVANQLIKICCTPCCARTGGFGDEPGCECQSVAESILAAIMVWHPISTVPKDGTFVLLGRFVKKCEYGYDDFMAIDRWSRPEDQRGWVGFGKFNRRWPPTHWMPLPPITKEKVDE